jgi:hypothetical protein
MNLTTDQRASVLGYASWLLNSQDRRNPVLVGQAALPLLEWAEQATDQADLDARMRALSRHHSNMAGKPGSPAEFVEQASVYYAFLVAGRYGNTASDGETGDLDSRTAELLRQIDLRQGGS